MKSLTLAALLLVSTAGAQVQKWEYALLTVYLSRSGDTKTNVFAFESADGTYNAKGSTANLLKEIAGQEYGSLKNSNKSTGLLNYLGSKGWEMVGTYTTIKNGYDQNSWYFKRQIGK